MGAYSVEIRGVVEKALGPAVKAGRFWRCPFHGDGKERGPSFTITPDGKHYKCFACNAAGDAVDFARAFYNVGHSEALQLLGLEPGQYNQVDPSPRPPIPSPGQEYPSEQWQDVAQAFVERAQVQLWDEDRGKAALSYLRGRGLDSKAILGADLGFNPAESWQEKEAWGLPCDSKQLWLPKGITIPWYNAGQLATVRLRLPPSLLQHRPDLPKYYALPGSRPTLYGADCLTPDRPALLLEGEIDALIAGQHAGDLVIPVATGSTGGSRRPDWLTRLALCPIVLIAYDADNAGESNAEWWTARLSNARRWRPTWNDVNQMAIDGVDIRSWVLAGLGQVLACVSVDAST